MRVSERVRERPRAGQRATICSDQEEAYDDKREKVSVLTIDNGTTELTENWQRPMDGSRRLSKMWPKPRGRVMTRCCHEVGEYEYVSYL